MVPKESSDKFISVISVSIDKTVQGARDILESLSVLDDKISTDIDSTYDLVQEVLKQFVDSFFTEEDTEKNEE